MGVGQWLHEEALQPLVQGKLDIGLHRVLVAVGRNLGHRLIRWDGPVHDGEQPFEIRRAGLRADRPGPLLGRLIGGLHQLLAHVVIAQGRFLFGQRQFADVAPDGQLVKRGDRLERLQHANGPAVDLNKHTPAGFGGLVGQRKKRAPIVRGLGRAEHAERDRHTRIHRQGFEPVTIVLNPFRVGSGVFAGNLKHPGVQLAEHTDQLTNLVPGGEPTRNRLAIGRLVVPRA